MAVDPATREAVRRLSFQLTGQAGQRITMDQTIRAACQVATADLAATVAALDLDQEVTA